MPFEQPINARFRRKVEEVEELAEQPIQIIEAAAPTASAPLEGLPTNPIIGRFYQFASRPGTLYFISGDNVWRALVAVPVI